MAANIAPLLQIRGSSAGEIRVQISALAATKNPRCRNELRIHRGKFMRYPELQRPTSYAHGTIETAATILRQQSPAGYLRSLPRAPPVWQTVRQICQSHSEI